MIFYEPVTQERRFFRRPFLGRFIRRNDIDYPRLPARPGLGRGRAGHFSIPAFDDKHTPNIPVFENDKMIGRYYEEISIDRNNARSNFTNTLRVRALEFVQNSVDAQKPFFLFFTPDSSHAPVYSSPAFAGKSRRGKIGDAIMELDWAIGSIMESVKSLGIMEDTIIVFSSDNGAACVGPVEQCGSNGPLLCCKQTTFDGGMRVPGILSWPGTVEPNQINNDVTGLMDLFTTGLALAEIPIPSDRFIDGKNLINLVKTKHTKNSRKSSPSGTHFFYRGDTLGAVRRGDYKMHVYTWSGTKASSIWHFCRGQNVPNVTTEVQTDHSKAPVIYNIGQDPSEKLPLPTKSAEYKQQRPILEKIIAEHQKTLVLGTPQLNYCDDSVMHWAPPGCEKLGKCLPTPASNYAKCYWDN
ncbi:unnamed protein product [Oikopleura dioica]|uniref:Sulfatase N-terminal domain-containing protein n=1 Tax=Oikopleura dioica TaxID=34765 RepID=E4YFR8_OIKDI|nr:unnamed protein product [Oikopleura dioica]